jgi:hypothetical protein
MNRGTAPIITVTLAIAIVAAAVTMTVGVLGMTAPIAVHCATPVKHGFTPMICTVPLPPGLPLKPSFPIPAPPIH